MKKLVTIAALLSVTACTAANQQKVNTAVDVVECKVAILKPYLDRLTSDQFLAAVAEENYFEMLGTLGIEPSELEATVAALKACHAK